MNKYFKYGIVDLRLESRPFIAWFCDAEDAEEYFAYLKRSGRPVELVVREES